MKPYRLNKLAAISAVALCVGLSSGTAWSAAYELDSGTAIQVDVTADVLQTSDVTVTTDIDFGNIGIKQDNVDTATLVMAPDGTVTEDTAGDARIVTDDTDTPVAGQIDVTGAFQNTDIHVVYQNLVDLTCATCSGAQPDLLLVGLLDNMANGAALAPGTGVQQGGWSAGLPVEGIGTTDNAGALRFTIGATIETDETVAAPYETGNYAGSFEMLLSY